MCLEVAHSKHLLKLAMIYISAYTLRTNSITGIKLLLKSHTYPCLQDMYCVLFD